MVKNPADAHGLLRTGSRMKRFPLSIFAGEIFGHLGIYTEPRNVCDHDNLTVYGLRSHYYGIKGFRQSNYRGRNRGSASKDQITSSQWTRHFFGMGEEGVWGLLCGIRERFFCSLMHGSIHTRS